MASTTTLLFAWAERLRHPACIPMINEEGFVLVVFNGEISNFLNLREELKTVGRLFRGAFGSLPRLELAAEIYNPSP